jgi:tol-pal system protein YbgF
MTVSAMGVSLLKRKVLGLGFGVAFAALALGAPPVAAQDAADLLVRTTRLENQLRQLSGQIEQLQFENRRLTDQLRKFQENVEFRLSEQGGKPGAAPAAPPRQPARDRRSELSDPAMQPGSPGAPRQMGQIGQIIDDEFSGNPTPGQGPLDISGVGRAVPQGALPPAAQAGPSVAATGQAASPRAIYDAAYAHVVRKEYEQAEMGFRQFLQSYPRDRLAPDATFWLGESYFQRQLYREAAEQFLRISRDYPKAGKGADSMLKLGMSLNGLGARDQACATFAKLGSDYPAASSSVRQSLLREQRRARCA